MWLTKSTLRARGMELPVSGIPGVPERWLDPIVKHHHCLDLQMSLFDARGRGADSRARRPRQ